MSQVNKPKPASAPPPPHPHRAKKADRAPPRKKKCRMFKKDGVATISARTHTRVAVENAAPGGAAPDVAVNLETYSYLAQITICAPIRNTFHILLLPL